jgi:hypothetical protein
MSGVSGIARVNRGSRNGAEGNGASLAVSDSKRALLSVLEDDISDVREIYNNEKLDADEKKRVETGLADVRALNLSSSWGVCFDEETGNDGTAFHCRIGKGATRHRGSSE